MTSGVKQARRLIEHSNGHAVVSLQLDLDPERFATAGARSSQIRSLIDEGHRNIEAEGELEHAERVGLREDLKRIEAFLTSGEAPFKGARALAVVEAALVQDAAITVIRHHDDLKQAGIGALLRF